VIVVSIAVAAADDNDVVKVVVVVVVVLPSYEDSPRPLPPLPSTTVGGAPSTRVEES